MGLNPITHYSLLSKMVIPMPTVAFVTLGCKVNQYDTQMMREVLKNSGYDMVNPDEIADVYVINTCTVTSISDRKSRQMIRRLNSLNPAAILVVTGCYAERTPDEIKNIKNVNLVLSNKDKPFIDKFLNGIINESQNETDFYPCITTFDDQTRALIKIEEGCDSMCTYCIVPYVRGRTIHSRPIDSIQQEVKSLAENGYKEVVFTGIHLGAYGKDFSDGIGLPEVLKAIHAVDGIERIRLSSIEPMDVSDELIDEISHLPKFAHHLHISLQSGSGKILRLMRRGYTSLEFENLINRIRLSIPDAGISTDVMVGFPGETDQDFAETCDLISRVRFSRLHVFRYSPREGTPAVKFPNRVPDRVSSKRSDEIIAIGDILQQEFNSGMLGKYADVLIEDKREGKDKLLAGFTSNYARVLVIDATGNHINSILHVKLIGLESDYLVGMINPYI
jgi:threonylcarbamoyladenosine tRNA methylthiotransferase MtaB